MFRILRVLTLERLRRANNDINVEKCTLQATVWKPLPSLVFGVICTMSGLLYLFLPETLGHLLPDTIEQAERLGTRSSP